MYLGTSIFFIAKALTSTRNDDIFFKSINRKNIVNKLRRVRERDGSMHVYRNECLDLVNSHKIFSVQHLLKNSFFFHSKKDHKEKSSEQWFFSKKTYCFSAIFKQKSRSVLSENAINSMKTSCGFCCCS